MITLLLMRHGAAESQAAGGRDFERDLSGRGKNDIRRMGARIKQAGVAPDLIVASAARRAATSAQLVAQALGFGGETQLTEQFYNADSPTLLDAVRRLPASATTALLVAHDPGISRLARSLRGGGAAVGNLSAGAVVALQFAAEAWPPVGPGKGHVLWMLSPKSQAHGE